MGRSWNSSARTRGFPKVLVEVYGDGVRTLRQLILQLLGPSLRLTPCKCKGPCDDHFQYCAHCDPYGFLLREDDHAEYWSLLECSYAVVSNQAPLPESFKLEQRWTQRQIIERAIELEFRKETRPQNVICFGYRQPRPNDVEKDFTFAPHGLKCTSSNSVVRLLNSQAWMVLLSRVGDMFMLHLLSHTSIFYPFPYNSYLQVTGTPISSLASSSQLHKSVQSGKSGYNHHCCGNPVGIGVHRASDRSQSKDCIHTPVPPICESKDASSTSEDTDKTTPLTESTGFFLSLPDSTKDMASNYGYQRGHNCSQKRVFTNNINARYKKKKGGGDKRQCKPKKGSDNACPVSQCKLMPYSCGDHGQNVCASKTVQNDSVWNGYTSKTAALDTPHFGQMSREIISFDRCSTEHLERRSVCLPGNFQSRNNICSESELVCGPNIYPELGNKAKIVQSCSNRANIHSESFHSPSCNDFTNGGRSKKRARPFSWQRRRKRRFEEKKISLPENTSHSWVLEDSTNEEASTTQQLQVVFSSPHLDNSLGIVRHSKQCSVGLQYDSSELEGPPENLKIATRKSDKILASDQMISLGPEKLSNIQAQGCQDMTLPPQSNGNELSRLKHRHQSQAGIVHRICCSSCCRDKDCKMVDGYQNLYADDGHVCYFNSSCLSTGHDYQRHLMSGRKCVFMSCISRAQKVDSLEAVSEMKTQCPRKMPQTYGRKAQKIDSSEAISEMKTQDACKMPQNFASKQSHFQKLNSHLICYSADQQCSLQNAWSVEQGMLPSNRAKMSFRCPCWLMLHTKNRDPGNTLINRRPLFYNTRFSCRAGFPHNHILNMVKVRNSGAAHLLGLIFGLPDVSACDSCSCHENFICGAKAFESPSIIQTLLYSLEDLIKNARRCHYGRLLAHHAPINMQSSEAFSMASSKITNLFPSEKACKTQGKGPSFNLHETSGKDDNPVALESTSHARAGWRSLYPYTRKNCLMNFEHINDPSAKLESQNANLAECFDENFHTRGSFPNHSCWQRFGVKRKWEDHSISGINCNKNGCDSNHTNKISKKGRTSKHFPSSSKDSENKRINSYTSYKEVVSFIWAVCRRIIPETLLGSKCNWRALRSNISKFVQLRRHETFSLQQCLYKLKTSHFPWLNSTLVGKHCTCLNNCSERYKGHKYLYEKLEKKKGWTYHDSKDEDKGWGNSCKMLLQQNMLANWIYWLFSSFIVPLIRAHFYVTESENGRQNVFYYQRTVWAKILNGALKDLCRKNYKRLSAASLASILQKRSLGFSQVRFLPKKTGVRPIANLGAPSTTWIWHQKNALDTVKCRRENKLAINSMILDRNNIRKCFKQKKSVEQKATNFVDEAQSRHNQDTKRGIKAAALHSYQQVSDEVGKERRNFCESDSHVKLSFKSVNSLLWDSHYCLKFERDHHPEDLGCSVFDYNDIYLQFVPFVLSLKGFSMGMPQLYIVVCDVSKAFDTINQDKLLGMIQNILRKEEYLIQRYTKVSCRSNSVKVSYERASVPEGKASSFTNFASVLSAKHSRCIFIDQAFFTRLKREQLLAVMHEHIKRNILRIGPHFYIQRVGIPQGSVLSSLLCSFYYGHLDRNIILPLLRQDRKQNFMASPQTIFGDSEFHGMHGHSSSSKILNEAQAGWETKTKFCEETDKISGIITRNSRRMRKVQESLDVEPCTNGRETEASCNILVHCSSDKMNEYETRNCKFLPPKSLLLRLIDDSLFISTSKREAFCFIASMHKGFKEYNCFANEHKTALNFELELEGKYMEKNIYKSKNGACFMHWNGLLINCHTLEIQADYTRYWGVHISSTLTIWRQKNPGYNLMVKLCQFMRPKCHPIFYDSNINSPATIRLNAYQAFLLCAMKFHAYVHSMPSVGGFSPVYLFQAIIKSTRYMHKLVKQRIYNIRLKSSFTPIFSLQQKETEWLGLYAYNKVLQKKQSRYKELLSLLEVKLHGAKYKDMAASPNLNFAVDDDCSSMFWQIQY